MDLPVTLDATRKDELKRLVREGAVGLSFDDAFYFMLGCNFALEELKNGSNTPDRLLNRNGPIFRKGRDLVYYFNLPQTA